MVDCLAADTLELLVACPGDPDTEVLREEFEAADGFGPAEELI